MWCSFLETVAIILVCVFPQGVRASVRVFLLLNVMLFENRCTVIFSVPWRCVHLP